MDGAKAATVGIFSRAASTYNAIGPRHFTYFARRLIDYTDIRPGDRVLDVATGTGEVLLASADRCGDRGQMVGVDLTPAMLDRAAATIRDRHLRNVEVRQMDAEQLEFPDASFDAALSAFGLSSFPSMMRALDECCRILRPGGRLGLVDSFGWYFEHDDRWRWLEDVLRSFGAMGAHHPDQRSADLSLAIARAGFTMDKQTEDAYDLVFRDEEEWWRWMWSHGTRHLLEAVPSTRREELKGELVRGLRGCCDDDGMIHGTMRALLMRARKSPQS